MSFVLHYSDNRGDQLWSQNTARPYFFLQILQISHVERELERAEGQERKQKLDPEWQRATCPPGAHSARSLRSLLRNSPPTGKESTVKKNVPGENMEGRATLFFCRCYFYVSLRIVLSLSVSVCLLIQVGPVIGSSVWSGFPSPPLNQESEYCSFIHFIPHTWNWSLKHK